ncbi:hypothetical protein CMV_003531 [Castanea mollissima]|uniref:Uncharacterized protein n=1 Tax=Castanea mollissima TaxID=60419 RepID=A0A8J4RUE4_9ROSI|nr:hypothetical protein CMV_003531 [Castanea mollissima]
MATESNLLDLEIRYDDDEHEELELENKSKQLKEKADFLKRDCKSLESGQPSSSSAPPSSSFSRVEATLATILDQLQLAVGSTEKHRPSCLVVQERIFYITSLKPWLSFLTNTSIRAKPKPKGFLHLQLKTGSNGESKHSMATEKKLSDVEIESDDDYELDEIEEHELDIKLKRLQEEAEALKKECKRKELEIEIFTASNAFYIESTKSIEQGNEIRHFFKERVES